MAIGIGLHCWYCDHGPCNGDCNDNNNSHENSVKLPKVKPEYDYRKRNHLVDAKINLYRLLLNINPDDMTDEEVDVMYSLSKDCDVKKLLNNES